MVLGSVVSQSNLNHPDQLAVVTEVDEEGDDEDDSEELIDDEADSTED